MVLGYTTGVFDLFHVGHVNLLRNARALCDRLIVGVTVDELVAYKNKRAVIPFHERLEVVKSVRFVDAAVPQKNLDKFEAWERIGFDFLFVGDDWYGSGEWEAYGEKLTDKGVRIVYLPYTTGTTSTLINETLVRLRETP